jgi:carboxyl-terminal processing protease
MSLKARSVLVLVVGTVLGLTVSLGSRVLGGHDSAPAPRRHPPVAAEYVERLAEVLERVRREYVDPIDDQKLIESAIRGMIEELDSHSRYLDSEQYEEIRIATSGNYSGVGLDVSLENGRVTVVSPLDDAPAARAGILPGDVVLSVDAIAVDATNVDEAISRMRGAPGTAVTLAVERPGTKEPLTFELKRAAIQVKTIRSAYLGHGYGYIRLVSFADTTADELDTAARELGRESGAPLRGVVLDLRNNPGGVLDAAIDVADRFLTTGLIVRGSGRIRQARFEQYAAPGHALEDVPLTVLINGGSASASEIVAGALKDHQRGRLIGERTYGKGSVQTVVPLGEGNALKLTTSRYITPSGRSINGTGIEPDVIVHNLDPKRLYRGPGSPVAPTDDQQLQEALRRIGYAPIAVSELP